MQEKSKLMKIIKSLFEEIIDEEELEEATVTGDIEGYSTPFAFTGNTSASKKKTKRISTNSTGYEPVNEVRKVIRKLIINGRK